MIQLAMKKIHSAVDFLFPAYKSIIISEVTAAVVKPYYLWGGWVFLEGGGVVCLIIKTCQQIA